MLGYLINRFHITDRAGFARYVAAVSPILKAHHGEILVGNDSARSLEGSSPEMTVVIQFPSEAAAQGFYDSPEYQPVKTVRVNSTANGSAIVVGGFVMQNVAAPGSR